MCIDDFNNLGVLAIKRHNCNLNPVWRPFFQISKILILSFPVWRLSEWVSVTIESEPTTNSANFDRYSLILKTFPETEFSSEYFTEMLLSYIFGLSVVKYGILSNNRRSKQQAVIDCLFFWLRLFSSLSKAKHFFIDCTAFILQIGGKGDPGPKGEKVCFHDQYIILFSGTSAKMLKRDLLLNR